MATFREITAADVRAVAQEMRACDRAEIFATRWDDCTESFASDCAAAISLGAIAVGDDGTPVAVVGAQEAWPGCWSVWMFAIDRWPEVALETTRFVQRRLIPALVRLGARRAECRSADGHHGAHRWLEYLGARREASHLDYGRNGETFHTYSWRIDDVRKSLCAAEGACAQGGAGAAEGRCGGGCRL